MASLIELASPLRSVIASQITPFIHAGCLTVNQNDELTLGEGFPVSMLPATAIHAENVTDFIYETGYWYFQIYRSGKPVFYALAKVTGPATEDWKVTAVFESPQVKIIDRIMINIDAEPEIEGTIHFLSIPAMDMNAIWLKTNNSAQDQFYVTHSTATHTNTWTDHTLAPAFFKKLKKQPIAKGVVSM